MNVKIGICDDNESFCRALSVRIQCILKEISCDISIYHNGKAVLEALAEAESVNNQFDIIFLDIQMPILDGFRTAEIIYKRYPAFCLFF